MDRQPQLRYVECKEDLATIARGDLLPVSFAPGNKPRWMIFGGQQELEKETRLTLIDPLNEPGNPLSTWNTSLQYCTFAGRALTVSNLQGCYQLVPLGAPTYESLRELVSRAPSRLQYQNWV